MASNPATFSSGQHFHPTLLIGAGVGAKTLCTALAEVNRLSDSTIVPMVLAPPLGAAGDVALALRRNGVEATAIQGHLSAQAPGFLTRFTNIIIDDGCPDTIAMVLMAVRNLPINVMAYLHMRYADGTIQSFAYSTKGSFDGEVVNIVLMARQIQQVTAPTRCGVFDGPQGAGAAASQLCHGHHRVHLRRELPNYLAGTDRDYFAVMSSINGALPRPAIILNQQLGPAESAHAAAEQAAHIDSRVIEPGQHFHVLEVFPGGIRTHEVFVPTTGAGLVVLKTRSVIQGTVAGRVCVQD